jgi:cystathionine gamma-lyase
MNGNMNTPAWQSQDKNFGTLAIHSGYNPSEAAFGAVVPPISLATTYEQDAPAKHRGFEYTRSGNPTRCVLEQTLAALDKGKHGMCFSSGLAATTNVASLLSSGDHVVCIDDVYGGTGRLFRQFAKSAGIVVDFVDFTEPKELEKHLKPTTKLIWIETPTNPTLAVIDIQKVSEIAHKFSKDIIVAVDNTFLTSYFQRPLELGADLVVYSLTKYMNGHSDVLMGAIVTNDDDLFNRIAFLQNSLGAVPSPFDCYLVIRSLKTLHVRMPLHMHNALVVSKYLESHPKVEKVLHPGLPSHSQHALALKQSSGHSGLISFYLKGDPTKFLQNLKLFCLAESLGGYESLAEVPSLMTHASVPAELRAKLGITDGLIRLSVGLESDVDLVKDLEQALKLC